MPIRPCVAAIGALAISASALAQAPESDPSLTADPVDARIVEILRANTHALSSDAGVLDGPGGELLLREARGVSFVCLGEVHLVREIPAFTGALLGELRDDGFTSYAMETGERIAGHVQASAARDPEALRSLFVQTPFTAAFIDHAPEFEMTRAAVGKGYDLWGLDQVFMGGARFNLAQLNELATDDETRSLVQGQLDAANEGFRRFATSGDTSGAYLIRTSDETWGALRGSFDGNDEALRIIEEMRASGEIYRLYGMGKNYESNKARIDLMKRHLAERVRSLPDGEKVVMRFGSVHMGRGYSELHQQDLGNAASELGVLRGGGSLHVLLTGLGRRGDDGDVNDFTAEFRPFDWMAPLVGGDGPVLIDLRPLRPLFHRDDNAEGREALDRLVWSYDMIVIWPELTQSERLPGIPSPRGG